MLHIVMLVGGHDRLQLILFGWSKDRLTVTRFSTGQENRLHIVMDRFAFYSILL